MAGTAHLYQIVVFTRQHSVSGGIFLHDQRLSDFLNDRREMNVLLRNASLARLENPARIVSRTPVTIIPKTGIVLAFEPPQPKREETRRFIKFSKERHEVFLTIEGLEAHGELHVSGSLDLIKVLTDAAESFIPLTHAVVTFLANPEIELQHEAVLINTRHVRSISEIEPKNSS